MALEVERVCTEVLAINWRFIFKEWYGGAAGEERIPARII
jgi:hypothetical protein